MAHETILATGQVCYRTKLMDKWHALAFAHCLAANSERFGLVEVHPSPRSRDDQYFVTFQPISEVLLDALHSRQWELRQERAAREEFIFWQDPDCTHVYWCYSAKSRETYQVTIGDCSCPDYRFRCQKAGIQCKHMIAWSLQRAAGIIIVAEAA